MEDFASLAPVLLPRYPNPGESWTTYYVDKHPFARSQYEWGPSFLFHFDRAWPPAVIPVWLQIIERVREEIERVPLLSGRIAFVPFTRVGRDFVLQCKPPYDGGYSTRRYGEFLDCGSCRPNGWILRTLARLHEGMLSRPQPYPRSAREELLAEILHATFVKPYGELFWDGDAGWQLYYPHITSAQLAAWQESADEVRAPAVATPPAPEPVVPRPAKQVIVMRKDLNMRKGKMIAQGAHASLAVLLDRRDDAEDAEDALALAPAPAMAAWIDGGTAKICVSVGSEAELDEIYKRATAAGLPAALIVDAGRTEFGGVPTKTCCAVGPAWSEEVDAITGGLPLL